jgi:hypothetical protein
VVCDELAVGGVDKAGFYRIRMCDELLNSRCDRSHLNKEGDAVMADHGKRDSKKEQKKQPKMTPKEKRQAKRDKKA